MLEKELKGMLWWTTNIPAILVFDICDRLRIDNTTYRRITSEYKSYTNSMRQVFDL